MSSIPVLTTNVKAAHPPQRRAHKHRKHAAGIIDALPYFATDANAPSLPQLQSLAEEAFARLMKAYALQRMGGQDGR